eukprot:827876-Pyramimonas_sp.AAC.1
MQCYGRGRCGMPCFAVQNVAMQLIIRHATPCCDILRFAALFYAMPRQVLQCIAHPLEIVALLEIDCANREGIYAM